VRGNQISRQWKILRLIESRKRGLTARELSYELEWDLRTVYRDLEVLNDAGFPLYTERRGKNSYWRMVEGFKDGIGSPFTMTELASLHMSRDIMRVFEGTPFHQGIEHLFDKIRVSLPPKIIRYLDTISANLKVGFGPQKNYEAFKGMISDISKATAESRCVEIRYCAASTGNVTARTVDPYHLWAMSGTFYLIGRCRLRDDIRMFAIDRIESLSLLKETFQSPKDFCLEEYLRTAFRVMTGRPEIVKVRFAPDAARVVRERIWHPTQHILDHTDGSLTATLEVPINFEIVSWILGFGSAAHVLQPAELRQRILEEHQIAAENYQDEPPEIVASMLEENPFDM
jgi:predicted DNA-binding transcriptional regulator YafY